MESVFKVAIQLIVKFTKVVDLCKLNIKFTPGKLKSTISMKNAASFVLFKDPILS